MLKRAALAWAALPVLAALLVVLAALPAPEARAQVHIGAGVSGSSRFEQLTVGTVTGGERHIVIPITIPAGSSPVPIWRVEFFIRSVDSISPSGNDLIVAVYNGQDNDSTDSDDQKYAPNIPDGITYSGSTASGYRFRFNNPSSFDTPGHNYFTAPANTTLPAGATYHLFIGVSDGSMVFDSLNGGDNLRVRECDASTGRTESRRNDQAAWTVGYVQSNLDAGEFDGSSSTYSSHQGDTLFFVLEGTANSVGGGLAIVGGFGAGQVLSVDFSGLMDDNGLPGTGTNAERIALLRSRIPMSSSDYRLQWWEQSGDGSGLPTNKNAYFDSETYTLVESDLDKRIGVRLDYLDGHCHNDTVRIFRTNSNAVEDMVGLPTVSGTLAEGELLRADITAVMDGNGLPDATDFTYRWRRADADGSSEEDISNAMDATYTPVAADVGKRIGVTAVFTDRGNHAETRRGELTTDTVTPKPSIAVRATTTEIIEGEDAVFEFTRTENTEGTLTVHFTLAESRTDLVASSFGPPTVDFGDGQSTAMKTIPTTNDSIVLPNDTLGLTLDSRAEYNLGASGTETAQVTVLDDDTIPMASIIESESTLSSTEGAANNNLSFLVRLNAASVYMVTIPYSVGGGGGTSTATSADYSDMGTSPLEFAVGETEKTITIMVTDDMIDEMNETVVVTLETPMDGRAMLGTPASATGTITDDDDAPSVSIIGSDSTLSATEGAANDDLVFVVRLSHESAYTITVPYTVEGGTSVVTSADYSDAGASPLNFAPSVTEQTITLMVTDDTAHELDAETVVVTLETPTAGGATLGSPTSATGMITDNDEAPVITVGTVASSVVEGMDAVFELMRPAADISRALTVAISVSDPSSALDVSPLPVTAVFNANSTTARVSLATEDDDADETGASVTLSLNTTPAPTRWAAGTPDEASITVTDNDVAEVSISGTPSVMEGEVLEFTVTSSIMSSRNITVPYTLSGTATAGVNYTPPSGSVTLAAGSNTATLTITSSDNSVDEPNRTVVVTLGTPTVGGAVDGTVATLSAAMAEQTATGTIVDNDLPTVTVAAVEGQERISSGDDVVFELTRSGDIGVTLAVTVAWTDPSGELLSNASPATTVNFAVGEADARVAEPTADLFRPAPDSTVTLTVQANPALYLVGTPDTAMVNVRTRPSNSAATGTPTITGRLAVSWELTAGPGDMADGNGLPQSVDGYRYQWQRADNAAGTINVVRITNATSATYTLDAADTGKHLQVLVSFTDGHGYPERRPSAWTAAVEAFDPDAQAAELLNVTQHALALLAPNLAASTVQVLTARFDDIAAGAPGGARSAANLGGIPLGAFSSGTEIARDVAGLFGLHLPAAGSTAAGLADAGSGAYMAHAGAPLTHASATETARTTGLPGTLEAQNGAARTVDAHSIDRGRSARGTRGAGGRRTGDTGEWRNVGTGNLDSPELHHLLSQSSFSVQLGAAHGAHGGATGGAHWTFWGRGATGGFEGTEKDSALDVEGESVSTYLGADLQRGDLALGLAVGWSSGDMDYAGTAERSSGELETELTSVHPYLHWSGGENISVYAMLGYGTGEATLKPEGFNASLETDLEMRMLATGVRSTLSGSATGRRFDLKLDAFWADLETDGAAETEQDRVPWHAADTQSRRVRLALVGAFPLSQGLWAEGELAARADGGDANTGNGMEVGAGLHWVNGGFSLAAEGRVLLVQSAGDFEDYKEWGASLSASYRAGGAVAGRGLRFTLVPAWGDVQSGVDALYESTAALHELGDGGRRGAQHSSGGLPDRLDFEIGYGLSALGGRAELLPFGRFSAAGDAETRLRVGTKFDLPHRAKGALPVHLLGFELFGEEQAGENRDRRVGLELKLGF